MQNAQDLVDHDVARVVERLDGAWEELKDASVFVTGGTGFIGRWMLESLTWAGDTLGLHCRIAVLTRDPRRFAGGAPRLARHPAVSLLKGDVENFWFPEGEFSHVLHLAKEPADERAFSPGRAAAGPDAGSAPGTRRVIEFALSHGARKLLFTSSGAVYGPRPATSARLREEAASGVSPMDLTTNYARGKYAAEALCRAACEESALETKIARCFALVGPHMDFDGTYAVGNFIRDAVAGNAIRVIGDGTAVRSYLHALDLAVWLWTVLVRGRAGLAYNVGSEEAVCIGDLARLVARVEGCGKPVRIGSAVAASGAAKDRYVPDTTLATSTLGLSAELGLDEAVRRTLAWYRRAGG